MKARTTVGHVKILIVIKAEKFLGVQKQSRFGPYGDPYF